jgi:spermidine synthase
MRFYELNPLVTRWARERFTFLRDARTRGADIAVLEGDGRILLERQLENGEAQNFDVLAIDAFSSDAIPIHLLTLQAFQTYLEHLSEDGILALNVTNRFVDPLPIVQRLADASDLNAIFVRSYPRSRRRLLSADWVLLTRNQGFLDLEIVHENEKPMPAPGPLWTDDFSSLFDVAKFSD